MRKQEEPKTVGAWASPKEHIPYRDALTNLPNRFLLTDRVRQALLQCHRRGQSLVVAYLDLEGVESVGERHGRTIRDELLVSISQRMKQVLREGDTLARLSADEFVAVLVDLNIPQDCAPVLDRLLLAASDPVQVGDCQFFVQAKIGIILSPQGAVDVDMLLRHVDQAFACDDSHGGRRYQMFDIDLSESELPLKYKTEASRLGSKTD